MSGEGLSGEHCDSEAVLMVDSGENEDRGEDRGGAEGEGENAEGEGKPQVSAMVLYSGLGGASS